MTNPCAACKHIRRACDPNCELAPYFPADKPHRFSVVHTVFGKSNVSKLLQRLYITQREQAADSLVYEAEARMRDPVYGCVSFMSNLQQRLNEIQERLRNVKNELAKYFDHDTVEFVIKNPHYFGFEPRESQQLPVVTATEQHRNLEQLRQMLLRSDRGFSIGDGGLGYHHMNVHDDYDNHYVGPSSGTFEMGGTSTSGYQIQPPSHH